MNDLESIKGKISKNVNLGMTIVEMVIAMFIFSLIMLGSSFAMSKVYEYYHYSMEQGMSVNLAQQGMKVMIEEMRGARQADSGAYAISFADDDELIIYADYDHDSVVERVHYYLDRNQRVVKKGVRDPSGNPPTYADGDATTTVIANYVVNSQSQPLFKYYNINYPADQQNNPLATPAQANVVRLAKIEMYINMDPSRTPDNIKLESFVEFRNLKDNW